MKRIRYKSGRRSHGPHRPSPPLRLCRAEANHRVANSLALLGGLGPHAGQGGRPGRKPFTNAEVRLMLDGIAARIATIGQLHRTAGPMPADGAIAINGPSARDRRHSGHRLFIGTAAHVDPLCRGECLVLTRHVQPIALILCEILTNAMKYAHPTGVPVKISLVVRGFIGRRSGIDDQRRRRRLAGRLRHDKRWRPRLSDHSQHCHRNWARVLMSFPTIWAPPFASACPTCWSPISRQLKAS